MITIIVAFIVSALTNVAVYYMFNKANPTATAAAVSSVEAEVKTAVSGEVAKVEAKL